MKKLASKIINSGWITTNVLPPEGKKVVITEYIKYGGSGWEASKKYEMEVVSNRPSITLWWSVVSVEKRTNPPLN
jgi:hypothetical protein